MFTKHTAALALAAAATTLAHLPARASARQAEPAAGGSAEPAAAAIPASDRRNASDLTVRIEPMMFYAALSGDFKLPVQSGTGAGSFTTEGDAFEVDAFDADEARLRPAGRLSISSGDLLFSFWGFDFQADVDRTSVGSAGRLGGVVFAQGDQANISFDFASYELTFGHRIYSRDFAAESADPASAVDVKLDVHILLGARLYDTDIRVERLTGGFASAEAANTFIEPIAGVRAELDLTDAFAIHVQASGGGLPLDDTSSYSFDISASFHYRPVVWADVFVGYRLLFVSLEEGENLDRFEFDGSVAGLFAGLTFRF